MLEICAADIESVLAAQRGGADRVELCSALGEGGTTPSAGLISETLRSTDLKVHVLIRPRSGDFIYSESEVRTMISDIRIATELGAHGIVIGALDKFGNIDPDICRRLIDAGQGLSVTFHRAFDMCADKISALEQIIEFGCNRILTSGGASTAYEGRDIIRKLYELADGRISIMAGCGVTPSNADAIMSYTGIKELHASARETIGSTSVFRHKGVNMGNPDNDEYSRSATSERIVRELSNIIHR